MSRLVAAAILALAGCASSPATQAARGGDLAALGRAVGERERRGDLSNAEAASLARIVADRDLRAPVSPVTLELVRAARPCVREVDGALAARMATADPAGAEAALERLEGGTLEPGDARSHATEADAAWRAVGTRGLVEPEDREARLRATLDPDPRVRRQAVRAAAEAHDPADFTALLEVARLDPEPIVRTEAVRALRRLGVPAAELVGALRDLWPRADEGLREDIAIAWASSALWSSGGGDALRVLVASGHGAGVTEGAFAVLRGGAVGGEVEASALALLARAIVGGSRARRLQAIAGAPLDRPELLAAVREASGDGDLDVRVGALARLAEVRQPGAVDGLVALASPASRVAARARFALATLGDRRVQAWLEQDLASPDANARLAAATSLAAMGVAARAAPLLADPDATVRARAACTILVAVKRR